MSTPAAASESEPEPEGQLRLFDDQATEPRGAKSRILAFLRQRGTEGATPEEIAQETGIPAPSIRARLADLEHEPPPAVVRGGQRGSGRRKARVAYLPRYAPAEPPPDAETALNKLTPAERQVVEQTIRGDERTKVRAEMEAERDRSPSDVVKRIQWRVLNLPQAMKEGNFPERSRGLSMALYVLAAVFADFEDGSFHTTPATIARGWGVHPELIRRALESMTSGPEKEVSEKEVSEKKEKLTPDALFIKLPPGRRGITRRRYNAWKPAPRGGQEGAMSPTTSDRTSDRTSDSRPPDLRPAPAPPVGGEAPPARITEGQTRPMGSNAPPVGATGASGSAPPPTGFSGPVGRTYERIGERIEQQQRHSSARAAPRGAAGSAAAAAGGGDVDDRSESDSEVVEAIVAALPDWPVSPEAARKAAAAVPGLQPEHVAELASRKSVTRADNPAGLLLKLIQEDGPGLIDRDARKAQDDAVRQERQRAEQQRQQAEQAETDRLVEGWEALSPEEQRRRADEVEPDVKGGAVGPFRSWRNCRGEHDPLPVPTDRNLLRRLMTVNGDGEAAAANGDTPTETRP